MLGFAIKKGFYDTWDNLPTVLLLNVVFLGLVVLPGVFARVVVGWSGIGAVAIWVLAVALVWVYVGTVSSMAADIVAGGSPELGRIFEHLARTWKSSVLLALMWGIVAVIVTFVFPFYARSGTLLSLFVRVLLFWIILAWVLAAQLFFPVRDQLHVSGRTAIRKSVELFFDNTAFTVAIAAIAAFVTVLSVLTMLLAPGLVGIMIWYHTALRLRIYKYRYLESHPNVRSRDVPWHDLLESEQTRLGKRTIRNTIFPWKE